MISPLFSQDCFKVICLFCLSPGSRFNRKEIKEKVKLNNIPLDKSLSILINSGIIKREKNYYSINFENDYSMRLLEICTKQYKQLKELPLDIFYLLSDLVYSLSMLKDVEVILFGSYAKLIYKEKSDIDIAILYGKKKPDVRIEKLEKVYGKVVELHYFEKKRFYLNKKDPLVKSILKDGTKLI